MSGYVLLCDVLLWYGMVWYDMVRYGLWGITHIYLALFSCCLVALGGSCHDNLRFRWAGQKTKEPSVVAFLDSRMTQWF